MAKLPKMLERRDTGEPIHVHIHVRICQHSISSRGDYSRAVSISFRACSGAATIRERRLFERGVYSVIYGSYTCVNSYIQQGSTEYPRVCNNYCEIGGEQGMFKGVALLVCSRPTCGFLGPVYWCIRYNGEDVTG